MKQNNLIIIAILNLALALCPAAAGSINLCLNEDSSEYNNTTQEQVIRSVIESENQISVSYRINSITFEPDTLYNESYWCFLRDFGLTYEKGTPSLPMRVDNIRIPVGYDSATVYISKLEYMDIPYTITPSRPFLSGDNRPIYTLDNVPPIKESSFSDPSEIATPLNIETTGKYKYINVLIKPCQYDLGNRTIRIFKKFEYSVIPSVPIDKTATETANKAKQRKKDAFKKMMKSFDYDPDVYGEGAPLYLILDDSNFADIYKSYLIVTCDKYIDGAKELALTKKKMGYTTYISTNKQWTEKQIKDSIQSYYKNDSDIEFVLLLGDFHDLPSPIRNSIEQNIVEKIYPTDYFYACMNGENDMTQDVYIGRIPISTPEDAIATATKINNYFFNPPYETDFYNTGIHVADYGDTCYDVDGHVTDSENCIKIATTYGKQVIREYWGASYADPQYFINMNDPLPAELRKPNFSWDSNKQSIAQSINNGAFYVLYRGHGSTDRWNRPEFITTDMKMLSNTNKLPLFINTTCWSGKYNDTIECLASSLLQCSNGGAIGVIAGSERTRIDINSIASVDLIKTLLQEGTKPFLFPTGYNIMDWDERIHPSTLGKIRESMFNTVSSQNHPYAQSHKEIYHVFGDPSTMIWTNTPTPFESYEIFENEYYKENKTDIFNPYPTTRPTWELTHQEVAINLEGEACYIGVYDHLEDKSYMMFGTRMAFPYFNPVRYEMTIYGINRLPFNIHKKATSQFIPIQTANTLTINPNPASSVCEIGYNFKTSVLESVNGKITINNAMTGIIIKSIPVEFCVGKVQLDVSAFPTGQYIVSLILTTESNGSEVCGTEKLFIFRR